MYTFQPSSLASPPAQLTTFALFLFTLSLGIPLWKLTTHVERDLSAFHYPPFNNQTTLATAEEIHEYQIQYPAHGMDIVVSLVRKPERGKVEWEIEEALQDYLHPFINAVVPIFQPIQVKSQILYISPQSRETLVNQLRDAVGTSHTLGKRAEIQLVLILDDEVTESFIVPHWGGITHHKPVSASLSKGDLRKPFGIFLAQLRRLLGFPKATKEGMMHAHGVPNEQELSDLKIARTNECIRVTARTLLGLRSLIESLPSSLRVPARVSELYLKSVQASESNPFAARRWSELAFFDSELVSVLYFPAEHTYAIYLPLLLPVIVTLLTATKKQLAIYKRKKALKLKVV